MKKVKKSQAILNSKNNNCNSNLPNTYQTDVKY